MRDPNNTKGRTSYSWWPPGQECWDWEYVPFSSSFLKWRIIYAYKHCFTIPLPGRSRQNPPSPAQTVKKESPGESPEVPGLNKQMLSLRPKVALISEPRFSTPAWCDIPTREKGKRPFQTKTLDKGHFPFLAWEKSHLAGGRKSGLTN